MVWLRSVPIPHQCGNQLVSSNFEMFLVAVNAAFLSAVCRLGMAGASPADFFADAVEKGPYDGWLQGRGADYDRSFFLPTSSNTKEGAAVFWAIHDEAAADATALSRTTGAKPWIQFAVAVQATGWVGFGLSEAGGMLGSDMVIWDSQDPTTVRDAHVLEDRSPMNDDCSNWALLEATVDDGWIILEVARNLDTGDSQDHRIVDDSSRMHAGARLISAWGDDAFGYHGLNVGRSEVRLFAADGDITASVEANHEFMNSTTDGSFFIRTREFTIPTGETTYHYSCFTYQDLLEQVPGVVEGQSITVIGGGPVLSPETASFVHHFVVYGSYEADDCGAMMVLAAWAPGENGMELPNNVGIPMLGDGQIKSILIQIHYHNPRSMENQTDSSGFQFYFTSQPREFEAAILEVGDPLVRLSGTPIGEGLSEWTFDCDGMCSSLALGGESVTVLQQSLHMHKRGTRMVNELIRDGEVVHTSAVDVFDFDQQGSYLVPMQPYEVKPGDSFRTRCYYRDGKQFGLGSEEEMCISFSLYYPAKRLTFGDAIFPWGCAYGIESIICSETLTNRTLINEVDLGRGFGSISSETCEVPLEGAMTNDADEPDQAQDPTSENESTGNSRCTTIAVPTLLVSLMMMSVLFW